MGQSGISGAAVATTLAGAVLAYSGIKGYKISKVVRDLISGQNPSQPPTAALDANGIPLPGGTVSNIPSGVSPISGGSLAGNSSVLGTSLPFGNAGQNQVPAAQSQALAQTLVAPYGWDSGDEWNALLQLWNRESGWNNTADNASSNAYGIPQALPYTKMPQAAWPASAGGTSDPGAQIAWGISYIQQRYGDPIGAMQHENTFGWY